MISRVAKGSPAAFVLAMLLLFFALAGCGGSQDGALEPGNEGGLAADSAGQIG